MNETEVAQELVKAWPGCWRVGMRAYEIPENCYIRLTWRDDTYWHCLLGDHSTWLRIKHASMVDGDKVPDISDGATKGALLEGLRELTNRPFLSTRYDPLNGWAVADFSERITGWHESEGIALAKGIIEVRS